MANIGIITASFKLGGIWQSNIAIRSRDQYLCSALCQIQTLDNNSIVNPDKRVSRTKGAFMMSIQLIVIFFILPLEPCP